jgi:hypothetical protein
MPNTIDTPNAGRDFPDGDFSKWVKREQIARVILFLVSDDSKIMSGASLSVCEKALRASGYSLTLTSTPSSPKDKYSLRYLPEDLT